jgi:hypothetical protein
MDVPKIQRQLEEIQSLAESEDNVSNNDDLARLIRDVGEELGATTQGRTIQISRETNRDQLLNTIQSVLRHHHILQRAGAQGIADFISRLKIFEQSIMASKPEKLSEGLKISRKEKGERS